MGTTFRYIAEPALEPSELGECQHCERPDIPSYDYPGEIIDPTLAANPQLAADEPEIHAACADCINGGNIRKSEYEIREIQPVINAFSDDPVTAIDRYHQIPHIPLMMQREDWPMCCGDWCEFVGNPADHDASVLVPSQHQFWNRGPVEPHFDYELRPESLSEVCIFQCLSCDKSYFIWQPT